MIIPFLKWPGGKRWLIQKHEAIFPSFTGTYFEPFLGGGAVFFLTNPDTAVLSDANEELINAYKQIRKAPHKFAKALKSYQKKHTSDFYYAEREREHASNFKRAVRFVYLNRTCFNGIYRVNLEGKFNVPIGTKEAVVLPSDDFVEIARRLKRKELLVTDFTSSISRAGKNDLIYADPPYTVKHNMNGFVKYNDKLFQWEDQERLRDSLCAASRRGARVVISNANHESIKHLYANDWYLHEVSRSSIISADPTFRGSTTELIISNFEIHELKLLKSPSSSARKSLKRSPIGTSVRVSHN